MSARATHLKAEMGKFLISTTERKQMSTKTIFKRIALVAVATLGLGMLSVVPSQADVSGLVVTTTNGTATLLNSDSRTAATINVQFLTLGTTDSVSVNIALAAAVPVGATAVPTLFFTESTTSTGTAPTVDSATINAAGNGNFSVQAAGVAVSLFRVKAPAVADGTFSAKMKFSLGETTAILLAGTYSYNAIVRSVQAGVITTTVHPFSITVAAAALPSTVVAAGLTTAFLQTGLFVNGASDSVVAISSTAASSSGAEIGVRTFNASSGAVGDTITATVTGAGIVCTPGGVCGKSLTYFSTGGVNGNVGIRADGTSGSSSIVIATSGNSFTKTLTFFNSTPATVTAAANKAFVLAGTGVVASAFTITVNDASGNPVSNSTVTGAVTATSTIGGAVSACAYNTTVKAYRCSVAGVSAIAFGKVNYTFTVVGIDVPATTKTATADITFSAGVAKTVTLTGAATGVPGEIVSYTLTLTDANGFPVADQSYNNSASTGGAIFGAATVNAGFISVANSTFTDTITTVSGVATLKGTLPTAGTSKVTYTLAGDGTGTTDAIATALEGTTLSVTTTVIDPALTAINAAIAAAIAAAAEAAAAAAAAAAEAAADAAAEAADAAAEVAAAAAEVAAANKDAADAATDAAIEATDAANEATAAALLAAEAADAATVAAEEARDAADAATAAIADLATQVATFMTALKAQITTLANTIAKIAKKIKA